MWGRFCMFLPSGFPVQSKVLEMAIVSSENIVSADESLSWPKTPTTTKHNQNNSGHPINEKSKGDFRGTLCLDQVAITRSDVGRPKMTRSYILARKIPWFFILPKINFKLSKVQTLPIFPPWEIQLHIQMCRIDYLGKEFAFLNFQSINQFHEKKRK